MSDPNDPNAQVAEPVSPAADPNAGAPASGTGSGSPSSPQPAPDIASVVRDVLRTELPAILQSVQPAPGTQNPAASSVGAPVDELETEIKLRKDQLAQVQRGEIDASYGPEIQAALSSAITRKEGRAIVERENIIGTFKQEYNSQLAQAYNDFPELKDRNSELAKETLQILSRDRSYARVMAALQAKGRESEKIDFTTLDPAVTLNAVHRAHSTLVKRNGGRPLSQQSLKPNAAASALEAGSGAPPAAGDDDLAKLEKQASDSGDPNDWRRLIKLREQRGRQKATQMI